MCDAIAEKAHVQTFESNDQEKEHTPEQMEFWHSRLEIYPHTPILAFSTSKVHFQPSLFFFFSWFFEHLRRKQTHLELFFSSHLETSQSIYKE